MPNALRALSHIILTTIIDILLFSSKEGAVKQLILGQGCSDISTAPETRIETGEI